MKVRRFKAKLCVLLVLAMALSMAAPAWADAPPRADVLGRRVMESDVPGGPTISVGCTWGKEIRFTYAEARRLTGWDPETLSYTGSEATGAGSWKADTDNRIEVSNRSDTGVQCDFRWESEAGYEHIGVGTSADGFRLHAAEYGIEPDSMTVTADVIKGTLEAGQEDYRLMGVLVLGVKAIDDGLVDTVRETMTAAPASGGSYTILESGAAQVPQGDTVRLAAMPAGSALDGDTYKWSVEGPAEIATEAAKGGEACGEREIDVKVDADAADEIQASCTVERASGLRMASALKIAPVHVHNLTIVSVGEEGHREKCSACGWEGETQAHGYDSVSDATCDACGYTREITQFTISFETADWYTLSSAEPILSTAERKIPMDRMPTASFSEASHYHTGWLDAATGEKVDAETVLTGDITVKPEVQTPFETDGATVIGLSAYAEQIDVSSLTVPGTIKGQAVTAIGDGAFSGFTGGLVPTTGKNPTGRAAVADKIENITISDSITSIGDSAFYSTDLLDHVDFGSGITEIGEYMFMYSTIKSFEAPSLRSIGKRAFYYSGLSGAVELPDGLKTIADDAFTGSDSMTYVWVPDSVTSLGTTAFAGCDGLKAAEIGKGVRTFKGTFQNCTGLIRVVLTGSVISISGSDDTPTFYGCTTLDQIYVGSGSSSSIRKPKSYWGCHSGPEVLISDTRFGDKPIYKIWFRVDEQDPARWTYPSHKDTIYALGDGTLDWSRVPKAESGSKTVSEDWWYHCRLEGGTGEYFQTGTAFTVPYDIAMWPWTS